jgi:hypothetical protein
MVWKASEREFREYEEKKNREAGGGGGESAHRSQNVRMNGKPVPDNRTIPANQQRERDLRTQKRKEQDTFEKRHPTAHKVIQGVKRVGSGAKAGMNRYVSSREEGQRRLSRATEEEREQYSDSWAGVPVWNTSTLPKRKSKKPSSRSGSSNDLYPVYLTNTLTGASYGGGLGGGLLGSTLPRKSTNLTHKKKKKTTTRRRRY